MENCTTCRSQMTDLLLDSPPGELPSDVSLHLADCAACRSEWDEMRSTFVLLDEWTVPDPTPYFDTRLLARVREAQAAAPEGWWERVRSFLAFSTGRGLRMAVAGALGVALLASGGSVAFYEYHLSATAQVSSPAVNDLRIFDRNAQALQQMDSLLDDNGSSAQDGSAAPTT